ASFASGTSSPIFAAFLAAFLIGIAAGAAEVAAVCERRDRESEFPAAAVRHLFLASLFGLMILPLILLSAPTGIGLICVILVSGFLVAKTLSVVFPLVAHFAVVPDRHSGIWISILYMANIVGSATGSMLTGFVMTDLLDMNGIAIMLAIFLYALPLGFCWASSHWTPNLRRYALGSLALGSLLVLFGRPHVNHVVEAMLYKTTAGESPPVTSVVENRGGIIAGRGAAPVYGGGWS